VYAWWRASQGHVFEKDFFVNVAAGFVGMALGTIFTAIAGLLLARNKLRQVSKPVLGFIQRLRIDGKLTDYAARRAVVCAVTLLSEGNVSGQLNPGSSQQRGKCPICTLDVLGDKTCIPCGLPEKVWRDKEFVKAQELAAGTE
jgi:hypothetical protein